MEATTLTGPIQGPKEKEMAFSPTATANGVPNMRKAGGQEVLFVPGDPGVTLDKGEICAMSNGVAIVGTDSLAGPHLRPVKSVISPAATQAFVMPGKFNHLGDAAKDLTLCPMQVMLKEGAQILKATIVNQVDETVVSYTAGTRAVECTTGFGADDRPNGALLYVYEGPGKGEVNIVEDYDHTGGAAELLLICHRAFKATLTTSSKFIVLGSSAAANAVGPFGRVDISTSLLVDVIDGGDDGDYMVYGDWQTIGRCLTVGQLPLI